MSLELRASETTGIQAIWTAWQSSEQFELEATIKKVDLREFLDTVARLRAVGLRETPQQPKLNILMPGGLRFTIVGEGAIQAYCQHGDISRVPYSVQRKERAKAGNDQVDLVDYGARIKLRREVELDKRNAKVVEMVSRWKKAPKRFRFLRRYTFIGPEGSGLRFDLSMIRASARDTKGDYIGAESLQMGDILRRPISYEIEAELDKTPGTKALESPKALISGLCLLLQGMQRSYALVRETVANEIIQVIAASTGVKAGNFPGPQPATLVRANIAPELDPNTPNIRYGNYNVTDKADGLRCLLAVGKGGRIFLADSDLKVYATGLVLADPAFVGTVLDGEWVRSNKTGEVVSRYYAFDIFTTSGGRNVTALPFLTADSDLHRLAVLKETVAALAAAVQTMKEIPANHSLFITHKKFYSTGGTAGFIFKDIGICMDAAASSPYYTDGVILTPNDAPLPVGGTSWGAQFKWKPPHDNTIDFLVAFEKEESGADKIGHKWHEDAKQMVRFKTLRLFVGGNVNPLFKDPRETILAAKPLPDTIDAERYQGVEFTPSMPSDPQASVCYLQIDAGTAAGTGADAAADLEAKTDIVYTTRTKDPISANCIVEMSYHPERQAGWRWEPIRVRWDKTGRYQRGEPRRTMNADWVANSIWSSIHAPVSEKMVRTGVMEEEEEASAAPVYYAPKKAAARDNYKVRGLAAFHNGFIKSETLLKKTLKKGNALLDLACGRGGDLLKWIHAEVGWVLGVDVVLENLVAPKDASIYGRYLEQKILHKTTPPMIFVQGDAGRNIRDTSGLIGDVDKAIVKCLYNHPGSDGAPPAAEKLRGLAANGFDVVSCMFAIHYFFGDRGSVDGLLRNIADNLKIGGFFIGCCFDGDSVYRLLSKLPEGGVKTGSEAGQDIWSIRRKYGTADEDVLPATDAGLGKSIDNFYISIGEAHPEFLVSWEYLRRRMAEIGCELLMPDELAAMRLQSSSALFSESYKATGAQYKMSRPVQEYSFLNRWFIFRRRSQGSGVKALERVEPGVAAPLVAAPVRGRRAATVSVVAEEAAPAAAAADAKAVPEQKVVISDEIAGDGVELTVKEVPAEPEPARPIFKFHSGAPLKDDLKIGRKDWARYLSTFTHSRIRDLKTPTVIYPTLEAAFAAARYQIATDKPEFGVQFFSTTGSIHQKYLKIRRAETAAGSLTEKRNFELLDEEGAAVREQIKPAEIKRSGAKWNEAKWAEGRDAIMAQYVQQRYETDTEFKRIMDAVKERNGLLVFHNGTHPTDLGGLVKTGGKIEGENKLGKFYMATVGLTA